MELNAMIWQSLGTTLAAANAETLKLIFFVIVMIVGGIMKMVSANREQAEKSKNIKPQGPPQPPPKRENRFRNEIEMFLEEVGRRRSGGERPANEPGTNRPARAPAIAEPQKSRSPSRPQPPRPQAVPPPREVRQRPDRAPSRTPEPVARAKPETPKPAPVSSLSRPGPGAEIASRRAPISDDLGTQVRADLAQYMDAARLPQQVQTDLGNAVERALRAHLGQTVTRGTSESDAAADVHPIVALLRSPGGLRNAVMVNEILGRPTVRRSSKRTVGNSG